MEYCSPTLNCHYPTGKLCLQNEELAKKSVVQMGRELLTSQHPVVRNNIVVILCDLAVRYSTKVDPYISTISSCLKDECLLVRKQTLTLLARLLQEDYIKWRGSLFFHFVSTLVDADMSKFAEFCLIHLLQVRHPDMFYRHFVECVFFFNDYKKHKGEWIQLPQCCQSCRICFFLYSLYSFSVSVTIPSEATQCSSFPR